MAKSPPDFVIGFARGVDNRNEETKLRPGFARAAENVDIATDGTVSVRDGYDLFSELVGAHSLWADSNFPFFLVAANDTLYAMDTQGAFTVLTTGLAGTDVSYTAHGSRVFWSDGVITGVVDADMTAREWGVETPLPTFFLAATSTGGLFAGRYGVTMTFGETEEGGAPDPVYVDVPEGGGIQIMGIPSPQLSGTRPVRIYRTSTNGSDFLYAATAAPGATTFTLGAWALGRTLTTLFHDKFPAATCLLHKAGRIFGASGKQLIWSSAMYYGLLDPADNFATFPDPIVMIAAPATQNFVLYVGTTKKTYLLIGESITAASQVTVLNHGVVPGSMTMLPAEELNIETVADDSPAWVGTDGIPYLGAPNGAMPLNKSFVYPIYDKAAAAFVENGGGSRYIVAGRGGRTSGLLATDTVVATVYDNGGGA